MPHETRKRICRSLAMLRDKKLENPWRKHGNIPLVNEQRRAASSRCSQKILIANRGEIACRVIKTAQADGHRDRRRLFRGRPRRAARRAGRRGGAASARRRRRESYLRDRQDHRRLQADRRRGGPSRATASCRRTQEFAEGAGGGGHRLHRPRSPRRSPRWATRSSRRSSPQKAGVSTDPGLQRRHRRRRARRWRSPATSAIR